MLRTPQYGNRRHNLKQNQNNYKNAGQIVDYFHSRIPEELQGTRFTELMIYMLINKDVTETYLNNRANFRKVHKLLLECGKNEIEKRNNEFRRTYHYGRELNIEEIIGIHYVDNPNEEIPDNEELENYNPHPDNVLKELRINF